jgi:integrase
MAVEFPRRTGIWNPQRQAARHVEFRVHEWEPLLRRAGMEDRYNFHMLRHAAASLFIAYLGWTPKRIQTVMGHSSVQMTFDLYGHLFEDKEADREAMAKLEAAVRVA